MLALIKRKSDGKWTVHKSETSCRGAEAEYIVWVVYPKDEEDQKSVELCGGIVFSLEELIEDDILATEAAAQMKGDILESIS